MQLTKSIQFFHIPQHKNATFLKEKYVKNGWSIAQIATEISSSTSTVRDALIRIGVSIRQPNLPHGNPAQPRFGQKKKRKLLVTHKAEQRAIEAIN